MKLRPDRRQRGVILLAMLLVFFVGGSSLMLGAYNNRHTAAIEAEAEVNYQLRLAKEALLAYAAYNPQLGAHGPGFLPCPVTTYTGTTPPASCSNSNLRGRLPQYVETGTHPNVTRQDFSDYNANIDEQFWYVIAPGIGWSTTSSYRNASYRLVNTVSSPAYRLTLDGDSDIVALIIAPGEALSNQIRDTAANKNTYQNYLDGENADGDNVYSSMDSSDGEVFNDRVIAITHDELMAVTGLAAAKEIKKRLDAYPSSPATQYQSLSVSTFNTTVMNNTSVASWYRNSNERWRSGSAPYNVTYTYVNSATARISFSGCTNMTFTLSLNGGITRNGDSC